MEEHYLEGKDNPRKKKQDKVRFPAMGILNLADIMIPDITCNKYLPNELHHHVFIYPEIYPDAHLIQNITAIFT